jgi:hypothetical protein
MTMSHATSRRSFLKTGAIVAAPLAMAAPAAVLADDGSHARLARLEDEKALAALHREVIRQVNHGERDMGVSALAEDPAQELQIIFAVDGRSATCRRACTVTFCTEFTGHSTLEQMHRLQGQGRHEREEARVLFGEYRKGRDGWTIESLRLA